MKVMLWVIALAIVGIVLFFLLRKGKGADTKSMQKEISYGPFIIKVQATTGTAYNINNGRYEQTTVSYSVWHEGKPVEFPGALQTNTGLPFLWRVYTLPDAPQPTLLAGSQSLYLIYVQDGKVLVEPVLAQSSDFASVQFLDSEAGQPGPFMEVFAKGDTTGLDQPDVLQGGRYLLVSEHAVLDIQTRKQMLFNKNNNPVDNYSYPQPKGAIAFSPDQKKIVFHASFQSWNTPEENLPDSEHALVVYNFETDKGYTVLYDDTDTRMKNFDDITRDWFNTYFEWTAGGDTLTLKKWDKLPYWTGSYDARDNYYQLYPVNAGMLPVFKDFVLQQMGWGASNVLNDKSAEYTGRTLELGDGVIKLDIVFKEDEQKISFSRGLYETEDAPYRELIPKIARSFDEQLSSGKHQEHFGRIKSETKRILGL